MSPAPPKPYAALAIAAFGAVIGSTFPLSVILGLNDISGGLSERLDDAAWATTLYNAGAVAALPLLMSAVAAFGRRRTMIGAGLGFAAASAAIAAAPNLSAVLFWRVLQGGFGGALPVVLMVLVMTSLRPGRGQVEGLTLMAVATTVGVGASGAIAAGLIGLGGWRMMFWAQAACGVAYALLACGVLHGERGNPKFLLVKDWPSYILLSSGLAALVVFFSEGERRFWFETWWITACLVCGLMAVGFSAATLAKAHRPLLHLDIFRKATFSWAIVLQVVFRFGTLLAIWVAPQFLARVAGLRVDQIADLLAPMCLSTVLATPAAYWISKHADARWALSLGLAGYAVAAALCTQVAPDWGIDQLRVPVVISGVAQAFFMIGTLRFVVHGLAPTEGPSCGVIFNYARVFGLVAGVAAASHLINEREKFHSAMLVERLASVDPLVSERLSAAQPGLGASLGGPQDVRLAALRTLARSGSQQAFTLAFADVFWMTTAVLILGAILVWALPRLPATHVPPSSQV